ncbi:MULTISPECIES: SurA N-terminal domain-containing protein [unclassified Gilliamella]|uniref:SurA N-terminal domain-containing protein n=1 Tax=unclassified Gilliamella TaxID=2685620 RepID=UPI0022698BE0|nr:MULTISPECIES: SurA N-terminal domain-containing protein [unclassified Gilliamella]MCX8664335.1 SurA N-terminal domain-containing protein [Gilliamella sp. B2887]MCX8698837.1 SurA N-terminal domain-containing protein [Gilliamella sp. B3000]
MMDTIRTAANHIVVKIIFTIIILSFIFTGIGFLGFGGGNNARDAQQYIAKVDGEGINRAQFEAQVREVTSGSAGDPAFIKQLRRNVLYSQITNFLSYKFSEQLNANISNERVKEFIKQQHVFFENGKFSNKKYLELLSANGFTPDSYGASLKTSLQQQQVINALVSSSFVLPVDSELAKLQDQTRTVYATTLSPKVVNMDDVKITVEDEKKYYEEHKSEFYRKERVKFNYILNKKYNYVDKIRISDEEVQQQFKKNKKDYSFPEKQAYSVIYVTDKEQADDIIKDLSSGGSFDNIVKTVNQSPSTSPYGKNGSLGWFTMDDSLPQAFKDANLKKVGQTSKPIKVDDGYIIVKLDDVQKSKVMDFDYAKHVITSKLEDDKLNAMFDSVEKKIQAAINKNPNSLEAIAKDSDLQIVNSDWSYYNDIATILRYPEVRDVAFGDQMIVDGQATGNVSEMITVGQGINMIDFVIQIVDYRKEGIAPFEEVKDEINTKLYQNIANERFKSTVNNILTQLNETGSSSNVNFSQSVKLSRDSKALDKKIVNMVFDLVPSVTSKRVFGVQYLDDKSATIVVLTDVKTPNEQKDVSSELLPLYINNIYYYLTDDIRSKAKIEIMPDANL